MLTMLAQYGNNGSGGGGGGISYGPVFWIVVAAIVIALLALGTLLLRRSWRTRSSGRHVPTETSSADRTDRAA